MGSRSPGEIQVLIVEDVDSMRLLLERVVSSVAGVTVSGSARTIREARLELSRRRPDLVFLDEVIPGESSSEFLEDLCQQGVPVILLTGVEDPTHPVPSGALSRMAKPGWRSIAEDKERFALELAKWKSGALKPKIRG